ncbi:hypothetical protein [Candidatus Nitrosotalea okcheonensis]|uniref:Uncharacterized protein n=1 Tax=Candidatus Nitrosotalea okcheonensis TaxID=1903276 RepID=A0A2H1FEP6_9ARCH|nr:hypothetical protein [Candidatus Nitrosotalea okcheonensis]SMH71242.1 exported protein of unknown function [Candidatus Nitrosotalea okcheonensis]
MQRIELLSLGLLLAAFVFNSAYATQILIVTDNGNVFPIANTSGSSATGTGNGNGTGNGVIAQIVTVNPKGSVIAGIDSATGNSSSLRPYNKVDTGTFAAGFQASDPVQKLYIPQMNAPYVYSNGTLQSNSIQLTNILSPSSTVVFSGSPYSTTSSSGISISGQGNLGILLNSGLGSTVVTGSGLAGGGSAFFGTLIDPTVSPTAYDGGTHGYAIFSSNIGTTSGGYAITTPVNKYTSSASNVYATYTWGWSSCNMSAYTAWSWSCGYDSGTGVATVNGYVSGSYYYVTSVSYSTTDQYAANYYSHTSSSSCTAKGGCSYFQSGSSFVPYITLYDKSPFVQLTQTYTNDFQSQVNFNPSYSYWLIVTPTSGGTTIGATNYDPSTQMFLQVTNLPSNIPFQILQNGIVGVQGVTSSSGTISLSSSQIAAGGQSSISGELDIYPNSPSYDGTIGTAVYDTVNNQMFNIPAASMQIYTPFAYIQIPMAAKTDIQNVVDNATSLISIPYLSKTYNAGSSMMVPIIPGLKSISFSLNGTQTVLKMSSIPNNLGISIVTPGTNSNSGYDTNGAPLQISADTGGEASSIAPKDGTMYALVNAQVSADTSYTTSATYNYQQTATQYIYEVYDPSTGWYIKAPCPQDQFQSGGCTDHLSYASSSVHAGPLDVYADVYVNGVFSGSQIIYYNTNPTIQQTSSVSSWSFSGSNAMAMHYPTSQASGLVQIPVHAGDLVEFYLRAHVDAYGDPISVPTGHYGVFTTTNQICTGSAAINLNSGSILTGIS